MGIVVPPGDPIFGDDCGACYPAGETPLHLWMIVAGVTKGAGWAPGMAESVNGTFELEQVGFESCHWHYSNDDVGYTYNAAAIIHPKYGCSVEIVLKTLPVQDAFFGGSWFVCKHNFSNDITEPPNRPFIGGTAIIFEVG